MQASTFSVPPRVVGLLDEAWHSPITVVCAEAGYGKSTALSAVPARGTTIAVRLRAGDADAARFTATVADAAGVAGVPTGGAGLAPALGRAGEEVLLVLDEVEHLAGGGAAAVLGALIEHAPANLHVVLSGRRPPAVELQRAEAGGRLHRVTAADLALTEGETAAVLGDRLAGVAARCRARSGGWPAAVDLARRRLSHVDGAGELSPQRLDDLLRAAWRPFAAAVLGGQPLARVLGVAAVVGSAEESLLAALGTPVDPGEWASLIDRGLLVAAADGRPVVAPVLADVARAGVDPGAAETLRAAAAAWWERCGRLTEALDCYASGEVGELCSFLRRCGHRLAAAGAPERVAEAAARCEPHGVELAVVAADARWLAGDWEGALAGFERVVDACGESGLPAAAAWRFGALLYLRDERARAESILTAARSATATGADDALVSAWLGAALWRSGDTDAAAATTEVALRQARASGDPRARAAAEVTRALVCASRGDRHGNLRAYRAALRAAEEAGDVIQLGRVYANLASKALEEGDYLGAVEKADRAVDAAQRHWPVVALALENKAEALVRLGRLDLARAAASDAVEGYARSGSLQGAGPQLLLGEVYRLRGDRVRARLAFDKALTSAELAEDAHLSAAAATGLAWVLARDDPGAAAAHAARALGAATELERAAALNASAWVRLAAGDAAGALAQAADAEAAARRTDDRAALAGALELRGAAVVPPDPTLLRAALAIRTETGDPIAAAATSLAVALAEGDRRAAARAGADLAALGASPDAGAAGLLTTVGAAPAGPSITTLGRFTVTVDGRAVPATAWQSRKARELVKLLATHGPRPLTREATAEALWPGEAYDAVTGRLSVLLSRLRAILDPQRRHPPDHYLDADRVRIALRPDRVRVDLAEFLEAAAEGSRLARAGRWPEADTELRRAEQLYVGDLLEDDGDADWAVERREQARIAAVDCARLLARGAASRGDDEDVVRWLSRLLERDPYDEEAWTALIAADVRLRRHGEARHHHAAYARRMAELDLAVEPFETLTDRVP